VRNDLRIYLTLLVNSGSGKQSFSKLEMLEWTKEHR